MTFLTLGKQPQFVAGLLVQMFLECQKMHDEVLEVKVQAAITSNKLLRIDNPIMNDKLASLKRKADECLAACKE